MKRRKFIVNSSRAGAALSIMGIYACKETKKKEEGTEEAITTENEAAAPFFKLSLAQWSIHKMIREKY